MIRARPQSSTRARAALTACCLIALTAALNPAPAPAQTPAPQTTAPTYSNGYTSLPAQGMFMVDTAGGSVTDPGTHAIKVECISAGCGPVTVAALPALPAGTNAIGSVTVSSLPALPAGTNTIGAVTVSSLAATSTPVTATIADTTAHVLGPFAPQLARQIWLTLNATVAASGSAQLLRSTDGGTTKLAATSRTAPLAQLQFAAASGVLINEPVLAETDAAATYYLSVTLTAGTVTVRVAQ